MEQRAKLYAALSCLGTKTVTMESLLNPTQNRRLWKQSLNSSSLQDYTFGNGHTPNCNLILTYERQQWAARRLVCREAIQRGSSEERQQLRTAQIELLAFLSNCFCYLTFCSWIFKSEFEGESNRGANTRSTDSFEEYIESLYQPLLCVFLVETKCIVQSHSANMEVLTFHFMWKYISVISFVGYGAAVSLNLLCHLVPQEEAAWWMFSCACHWYELPRSPGQSNNRQQLCSLPRPEEKRLNNFQVQVW